MTDGRGYADGNAYISNLKITMQTNLLKRFDLKFFGKLWKKCLTDYG